MLLSNCVVQVMRVWSLAAVLRLSLLARHDTLNANILAKLENSPELKF